MFDKIYRQAMDDIPLNSGLLADLKKQAEQIDKNKTVAAVKKKPVFNVYRYGFAAAALIVVVLGANVFSSYMATKNSVANKSETYTEASETAKDADTAVTQEPGLQADSAEIHAEEAAVLYDSVAEGKKAENQESAGIVDYNTDIFIPTGENAKKAVNETINKPEAQQTVTGSADHEDIAVSDDGAADTGRADTAIAPTTENQAIFSAKIVSDEDEKTEVAEAEAISEEHNDNADAFRMAEDSLDKEGVPGSGGSGGSSGGGSSMAAPTSSSAAYTKTEVQWSVEEYCSHFGFDISELVLPGDMKNSCSGSAYAEEDENGFVKGGRCNIYYAADEKTVLLTLSTDVNHIKSVANGEKISSFAWVKPYGDGVFTVYAYSGNRGYIAELTGFSEEEMTAFVNSLK